MFFEQSYQLLNPIALNHLHNVISDPQPFLIHQKRRLDFFVKRRNNLRIVSDI